jgi:hypothetical protein
MMFLKLYSKSLCLFFYNIWVYSHSWNAHLQHVQVVLNTLWEHHLSAKMSKYLFGQAQVSYLGHIVID